MLKDFFQKSSRDAWLQGQRQCLSRECTLTSTGLSVTEYLNDEQLVIFIKKLADGKYKNAFENQNVSQQQETLSSIRKANQRLMNFVNPLDGTAAPNELTSIMLEYATTDLFNTNQSCTHQNIPVDAIIDSLGLTKQQIIYLLFESLVHKDLRIFSEIAPKCISVLSKKHASTSEQVNQLFHDAYFFYDTNLRDYQHLFNNDSAIFSIFSIPLTLQNLLAHLDYRVLRSPSPSLTNFKTEIATKRNVSEVLLVIYSHLTTQCDDENKEAIHFILDYLYENQRISAWLFPDEVIAINIKDITKLIAAIEKKLELPEKYIESLYN